MAYKTIIFDLDGTLLDTLVDLRNSVNYTLQHYGYPQRSLSEIRSFVGNGVKILLKRSFPVDFSEENLNAALDIFRSHYAIHLYDNTCLYDGIEELLQKLNAQHYNLAIVSNKLDSAVKELNARFFSKYISLAIGTPPEAKKPDPYCIYQVLEQLKADKDNTVYIGDSEVDLQTAKNAGIDCISAAWGFRDPEFLIEHGADKIVEHPMDILNVFTHHHE